MDVNKIKAAVTGFCGALTALFGWMGWLVVLFVSCMGLDWLTGSAAAAKKGEWSSSVARQGLWHKAGSIVAVLVAGLADIVVGLVVNHLPGITLPWAYEVLICPIVLVWYIITELGSIVENAGALGAPVPGFLARAIRALKSAADKAGGEDDGAAGSGEV